jgi:UV DNA damage endonuclease
LILFMKIGYPCINLSLPCRSSTTFRLKSYSAGRIEQTIENNLDCLMKILELNVEYGLLFFRISSDLVTFASHPVCTFPWQKIFGNNFQKIGVFIKKYNMRVSMHPDQFVLINSIDEDIFHRSVKELYYHAEVLDLLTVNSSAKIQIHVGGVYGEKDKSIRRFIDRYKKLPDKITKRLVIENDDRLYSIDNCLLIHEKTNIPLVFDVFHFKCNNNGESIESAFSKAYGTWAKKDGLPIVDYSSQELGKKKGTHARSIDIGDFGHFIKETKGFDFDIMCEIKDKEKSALKASDVIRGLNYGKD